jgi:hypothetical protein
MDEVDNEKLHDFTIDLSQKASNIKNQITNQGLLIESINYQSNQNEKSFEKNKSIFDEALIRLDKDKRNIVIFTLLFTIFILVFILRN